MTWAERYRAAAIRCNTLADVEKNDLTREALREAASRYNRIAVEHEENTLKARPSNQ